MDSNLAIRMPSWRWVKKYFNQCRQCKLWSRLREIVVSLKQQRPHFKLLKEDQDLPLMCSFNQVRSKDIIHFHQWSSLCGKKSWNPWPFLWPWFIPMKQTFLKQDFLKQMQWAAFVVQCIRWWRSIFYLFCLFDTRCPGGVTCTLK